MYIYWNIPILPTSIYTCIVEYHQMLLHIELYISCIPPILKLCLFLLVFTKIYRVKSLGNKWKRRHFSLSNERKIPLMSVFQNRVLYFVNIIKYQHGVSLSGSRLYTSMVIRYNSLGEALINWSLFGGLNLSSVQLFRIREKRNQKLYKMDICYRLCFTVQSSLYWIIIRFNYVWLN